MKSFLYIILFLFVTSSTLQSFGMIDNENDASESCIINIKRQSFKKRNSFVSKLMYNGDKSQYCGYRCLLSFYFTSKEKQQKTIDPLCFYLEDDQGNVYAELDTESEDYRSNLLTGPEAVSPNNPIFLKLTFVVPSNTIKYTLKFKGYK